MDLAAVAALLPAIFAGYDKISQIITGAKSSADIITKVASLSPQIAEFLKWAGSALFPQVHDQLQDAAAAITIFGKEFVKAAQTTLNIVSPLLGLPAPNLMVDGLNGPLTQAATKAVQDALAAKGWKDLVSDGWYGFNTRDAINEFLTAVSKHVPTQISVQPVKA